MIGGVKSTNHCLEKREKIVIASTVEYEFVVANMHKLPCVFIKSISINLLDN